jgi:hypothetical protein
MTNINRVIQFCQECKTNTDEKYPDDKMHKPLSTVCLYLPNKISSDNVVFVLTSQGITNVSVKRTYTWRFKHRLAISSIQTSIATTCKRDSTLSVRQLCGREAFSVSTSAHNNLISM